MAITFIAPAFNETQSVDVYIGSLLCQTNPNWKTIIYHNGDNKLFRERVNSYKDPRIVYKQSENNNGCYGCFNRIDALNNMVDTEYVVQSSIQDYWLPVAVQAMLEEATKWQADLIHFDCLHNHLGYGVLKSQLEISKIDWCNFAIKTDIAKSVGINNPEAYAADGMFIEDCLRANALSSIIKIDKVLTIHN